MSELVTLKLSFIKKTLSTDETMEESLSGVECYVLYDETDTDNGIYLSNITLTRYPNKVGAGVTDILDAIPHVDGYSNKIYGYIIEGSNELTLFCNIGNIDVLPNNIEITYPSYNSENDRANYINHCTFGILYSDQYSQNRLVISGNEDEPNCDWWTDDINVYAHQDDKAVRSDLMYNDLTYFPEENYCYYGGDQASIVGYDVDENGKLVVFKNSYENEPTIYFREGAQIYNNETATYDYKLNMFSGNAGAYPLNNKLVINFAGRTLFLSNEKNLAVLLSTDALKDKGKYIISSSKRIDAKLSNFSKDELSKAALFSDSKFLYLAIGSLIFACRYDEFSTSDYQYEWYLLDTGILKDNEKITTFFKNEEDILFATNLGNVFAIKNEVEGEYEDNRKVWLTSGDFNNKVFRKELTSEIEVGDFLVTSYYLRFNNLTNGKDITVESGEIITANNEETRLFLRYLCDSKRRVFIMKKENPDQVYSTNILYDDVSDRFYVQNVSFGDEYALSIIEGEDSLIISDVDDEGYYTLEFKVDEFTSRNDIDLVNLNPVYSGYVKHVENVSAVYVSAPIHMGALDRYKNIYSYTLTNDTRKKSDVTLAIISNSMPLQEAKLVGDINDVFGFSLSMFDFTSMSLAQDYIAARSYTKYRNIVRQRFTDFVFYNKKNTNAVLSNMNIVYTINNYVVGGD